MKIIQSFCSFNQDMLTSNFGWLSPKYHLMAWTLSSLYLSRYYKNIGLYTDGNGFDILINRLKLPYKDVQFCESAVYGRDLWAMPKILTYSLQNNPFIHVDGDVFVLQKFDKELEQAGLIAQNREICTDYYHSRIINLRDKLTYIPKFLDQKLRESTYSSYNAGIIGGNDIDFLKAYAKKSIEFVQKNMAGQNDVNFNVLFEQILYGTLAKQKKKNITCLFKQDIADNGYTKHRFCDYIEASNKMKFMHILGGNKRDSDTCRLIAQLLYREYPDYFFRILKLFNNHRSYFSLEIENRKTNGCSKHGIKEPETTEEKVYKSGFDKTRNALTYCNIDFQDNKPIEKIVKKINQVEVSKVFSYECELESAINKWLTVSQRTMLDFESRSTDYLDFYFLLSEAQKNTKLEINPFLQIVDSSFEWSETIKSFVKTYDHQTESEIKYGIAYLPDLFFTNTDDIGVNEVIVDEIDYNILQILSQKNCKVSKILKVLAGCFPSESENKEETLFQLVLIKLKYLFLNKCIFIKQASSHSNIVTRDTRCLI